MRVPAKVLSMLAAAAAAGAPVASAIAQTVTPVPIPPSIRQGVDMIMVDADAMPLEPEVARAQAEDQEEESWTGAPIDLMRPVHHLYTDLRRQLVRYQLKWSGLPQLQVPATGAAMALGSRDERVPLLRERLGLSPAGGYDDALKRRVAEYQRAHGLGSDGAAGTETLASLNRGAAHYERLILVNLERARRLPAPGTGGKYILVDAGAARLWMYEDGRPVDSMKVIVGAAATETPMMAASIRYAAVNPYWNVPPELVKSLIAPRVLSQGPSYLSERRYQVLDSWQEDARLVDPESVDWRAVVENGQELRVRQLPGGGNSMGEIKFMMPNEFGIYLHDTPNKALFAEANRWISNGCVRVEDARRLAQWIFNTMPQGSDPDREDRVDVEQPVPVYITYLTVGADSSGPAFRADPYGRDARLLARFDTGRDRASDPVAAPRQQGG